MVGPFPFPTILSVGRAPWLVARTQRSLANIAPPATGRLLVQAGAWLVRSEPLFFPVGKGFIGLGWVNDAATRKLRAACGGDFTRLPWWKKQWRSLPPVMFFSSDLAELLDESDLAGSALQLMRSKRVKLVHLPQLDVHMDPNPRVMQVVTTLQIGGAERVALDLAAEMNRLGTATAVGVIGKPGRAAFPQPSYFFDASEAEDRIAAMVTAATGFGADLVHTHLLNAEDIQRLSAAGWPVVNTLHNTASGWPRGMETLTTKDVALMLGCAQAVEREFSSPIPSRTVWNGISARRSTADLREEHHVRPDDLVFLALANVRPQKRFEMLGPIFLALQQHFPERKCHLWVAGHGSEQLELPAGGKGFGLLPDPTAFLNSCQVLLCPSRHEGLSLAQLEALSLGKHVVAMEVGGTGEVAGIHRVAPDASPEEFADVAAAAISCVPPGLPKSFTRHAMAIDRCISSVTNFTISLSIMRSEKCEVQSEKNGSLPLNRPKIKGSTNQRPVSSHFSLRTSHSRGRHAQRKSAARTFATVNKRP